MTTISIQKKIQNFVDNKVRYIEENGKGKFSTCSASGWDQDVFIHRMEIIDALRNRGYEVMTDINYGVLDVYITKKLGIK